MKITDKKVIWYLGVVAIALVINTFAKQYSESRVNEYNNEVVTLQNTLNAEIGRLLYYMIAANQEETLGLLATTNKSLEVTSFVARNISPTGDAATDSTNLKKDELKKQLLQKKISLEEFYSARLNIDASAFGAHLSNYNNLYTDLTNKIYKGSQWSLYNHIAVIVEVVLILLNVIGQGYLLLDLRRKNKASESLSGDF